MRSLIAAKSSIACLAVAAVMVTMTPTAQAQQSNQMGNAARVGQHASAASHAGTDDSKVKANDKAYNAALKNLPDKQYDPWRGVR